MKKFINIVLIAMLSLFIFIPSSVLAAEPVDITLPRVIDDGELLSTEEALELEERIKLIGQQHCLDIVVHTTNTFDGKSDRDYAYDYYDYNNYGYTSNKDGILLVVNLPERKLYISTTGKGIEYFSDYRSQLIGDTIKGFLGDAEYSKAFNTFLDLSSEFLKTNPKEDGYNSSRDDAIVDDIERDIGTEIIIGAVICLVLSLIIVGCMVYSMNTARKNNSAINYTGKQGISLTVNRDIFTRSHTSKSKKPDNSSNSGGSSTHTSSSGSSHGGGGGSF